MHSLVNILIFSSSNPCIRVEINQKITLWITSKHISSTIVHQKSVILSVSVKTLFINPNMDIKY